MAESGSKDNVQSFEDSPVLIVEDSKQYATILQKMLAAGFGFKKITHVESVEDALKVIGDKPEHFKFLFVDYNFPSGVTGGELLAKLKATNLINDKIAFLITSEPTPDNVKQAVMSGAFGVVAKPFDRSELTKQLDKARRSIEAQKVESF